MQTLKPFAFPEVHIQFWEFFRKHNPGKKILDAGAGSGSFTQRLFEAGYDVEACDFSPENFQYPNAKFTAADFCSILPYEDNTFDAVVSIEVIEHLHNPYQFISECSRVLKPGGLLLLTTPNIMSLKSRMRFLFKGYFYNFGPVQLQEYNAMQHIMPLPLDQYRYLAKICNLEFIDIGTDKKQRSSQFLYYILPHIKETNDNNPHISHNNKTLLLGRIIFMSFIKTEKDL